MMFWSRIKVVDNEANTIFEGEIIFDLGTYYPSGATYSGYGLEGLVNWTVSIDARPDSGLGVWMIVVGDGWSTAESAFITLPGNEPFTSGTHGFDFYAHDGDNGAWRLYEV